MSVASESSDWTRVTSRRLCEFCERDRYCCYTDDGAVLCWRTDEPPGGWYLVKGTDTGNVFRRSGDTRAVPTEPARPKERVGLPPGSSRMTTVFVRSLRGLTPERTEELARSLRLPVQAIDDFAVGNLGYCERRGAYVIAETSAAGEIIGTQYRWLDGTKRALGKRGIMGVRNLTRSGPLYVCEGFSDGVAACALGFKNVLALPSAGVGVEHMRQLLRWEHYSEVVIFADPKPQEQNAARRTKERLQDLAPVTVITPPGGKDLRAWVNEGATREDVERLIVAEGGWRSFPTDTLPTAAGELCARVAHALRVDPAMPALPVLAVLAGCIGATRVLEVKRGHQEPSVVWSMVVAKSGTGKSPALRPVLAPLRDMQRAATAAYEALLPGYEQELANYKDDARTWRKKRRKALDRGEEVPPRPEKPKPPPHTRYLVSDATVEALAVLLKGNPRGLLFACDELSGFFGSLNRYAKGAHYDEAHYLEMFDAGPLVVDRKTSPTVAAPRAALSILGGIQPSILERVIRGANTDNGMAARFLFARPPPTVMYDTDEEIPVAVQNRYAHLVRRLLRLDFDSDGRPRTVRLSSEARRLYQSWVNARGGIADRIPKADEPTAAALAKIRTYAARLALVFHCCEADAEEAVSADCICRAIRLADWFAREAARLYAHLAKTAVKDDTDELVAWIKERGGFATPRELQMTKRRYKPPGTARARLEKLADEGYGKIAVKDGQRGFNLSDA